MDAKTKRKDELSSLIREKELELFSLQEQMDKICEKEIQVEEEKFLKEFKSFQKLYVPQTQIIANALKEIASDSEKLGLPVQFEFKHGEIDYNFTYVPDTFDDKVEDLDPDFLDNFAEENNIEACFDSGWKMEMY